MTIQNTLIASAAIGACAVVSGTLIGGILGNIVVFLVSAVGLYFYLSAANKPKDEGPTEIILPPLSPLPEITQTENEVQAANDAKIAAPPAEAPKNFDDSETQPPP
jgi:hypothetical protein